MATPTLPRPLDSSSSASHPAAPPPRRAPHAWRRRLTPFGFLSPTLVLLAVLMATPIAMVIWYSLFDRVITARKSEFIGFDNYAQVLADPVFYTAVKNTAIFTGTSVVAHFVIGLAFALLLNTPLLSARVRAVFRVFYILPWLFTIAITAVLWRMLLNPNGVVNYLLGGLGVTDGRTEWLSSPGTALWAVTFINIWAGYPFFMVSLLAGLQGISADLYEAARVDGAGAVKRFFHVTVPQLRPIIISMALLDVIWTTQQFALIWMTTGGGPVKATEMLSTFTYKLAFADFDFAVASAAAVIVLVLSMVLAVLYVRHQKARD
ncbi:carbohydrate ABC transporter permease [Quadrisphaera setariae]|uniref:carbohydrate ABC transporter permease n=1 Tax=Quadrisphaera setariae TaxID=2593304 RepID=UPI001C9CDF12|nr:sugar ABC transporter permease [Quadrisphaera setariae]